MLICLHSISYANVKRLIPLNVKGIETKMGIIPHENPNTPLKSEPPAAGETLQRLRGGGCEKTKRLSYLRFKALFLAK